MSHLKINSITTAFIQLVSKVAKMEQLESSFMLGRHK